MTKAAAPLSAPEALVRIRMAIQRQDSAGARALAEAARRDHPGDAALADAAGDLALKAGNAIAAQRHFAAAARAAPTVLDYAVNHAIALQALGQHRDAIARLASFEREGRGSARYASVRAMSHRALGDPAFAARWYDVALAAEPGRVSALHGRARVALDRGEMDALARFDAALKANPGDPDLWLGKAQALDVAGDRKGASIVTEQLCAQAPGFIAALSFLASLRLAEGETDFAAPFANAAALAPQDPNIAAVHIEALAGRDHAAEAADVAAQARLQFPEEPHFALLEAVHAGSAGEWDRAEALFAELPGDIPQRALHEARHRIRGHQWDRAQHLLDEALDRDPWNTAAWAYRGIVWRATGDPRAQWLHGQHGLVQVREVKARAGLFDECAGFLRELHKDSAQPLGQSLRGGTQTRGVLFHRTEPLLAKLHEAVAATLEDYRTALPPADAAHPLLRHRDTPWRITGSWSVRLTGGSDHHAAHIHRDGIISSALYIIVPAEDAGSQRYGWLELGRPKRDLGLDLPPLRTIAPVPGHVALFPSTLYHGTTAFTGDERMTVAFDVAGCAT